MFERFRGSSNEAKRNREWHTDVVAFIGLLTFGIPSLILGFIGSAFVSASDGPPTIGNLIGGVAGILLLFISGLAWMFVLISGFAQLGQEILRDDGKFFDAPQWVAGLKKLRHLTFRKKSFKVVR